MKRTFSNTWMCLAISCLIASTSFADDIIPFGPTMQSKVEAGQSISQVKAKQDQEMFCGKDYVAPQEMQNFAITCWEQKQSKITHPDATERQLLESDKNICTCLGESKYEDVQKKMNGKGFQNIFNNGNDEALKNFQDNVALSQKRLQNLQNGMLFQASTLSNSEPSFIKAYSQGQMTRLFKAREIRDNNGRSPASAVAAKVHEVMNEVGNEVTRQYVVQNLGYDTPMMANFNNQARQRKGTFAEGVKSALLNFNIPAADTKLLTETKLAPNQCVGAREFLAYKQIPTEPDFYKQVAGQEFRLADWDYKAIERRIKELAKARHNSRRDLDIQDLRLKLSFLNKNPMFKSLFAASSGSNQEYFETARVSSKDQNEIINNPAWTKLEGKKKELFEILKGLNPESKESLKQFREKTTAFFTDKDVGFLTNLEVQKSIYREFDKLKNPSNLLPAKLPSTQKELEAMFADNTNLISPALCKGVDVDLTKCVESYASYCRLLTDAEKQMDTDDNVADVTLEGLDDFDPDIKKNPEFQAFNDRMCNTRQKSSNPSNREAKTFFQFKDDYCKKHAVDAACTADTAEGMKSLREKYRSEFPTKEISSNHEGDRKKDAIADNIMDAYAPSKGLSKEKAKEVAETESSPQRTQTLLEQLAKGIFGDGNPSEATEVSENVVPVPSSGEGSSFSSFAKGMESFATSMGGQVDDVTTPVFGSAAIAPTAVANNSDDAKLSDDDKEKIRSQAESEISKSKKEIQAATSAAEKESLETRMKLLESLLAQKNESEGKYQKLIDELTKKTEEKLEASNQAVAKAEAASNKKQNNKVVQNNYDFDEFEEQRNRSPASYGDSSQFSTGGTSGGSTGGSFGGAKVSGGARGTTRAAANFNTALLEAQEAKTGKINKSSDGSIIVASDAETPVLKSMSNAANGTNDYAISVTAADYMGFESQNIETLKRYQEKLLGSMDSNQPVRMLVKSDKKEPLEFFVVKEGDKLFFKPVRKSGATLEALKMAVKKTP